MVDRPVVRVDFGSETPGLKTMSPASRWCPAIAKDGHYLIADPTESGWMSTDPSIHATLATDANKAFSGEWKPMVKMLKKWNEHHAEPVVPSFLVEVMALKLIHGEWTGTFPREIRAFFAAAAERMSEDLGGPGGTRFACQRPASVRSIASRTGSRRPGGRRATMRRGNPPRPNWAHGRGARRLAKSLRTSVREVMNSDAVAPTPTTAGAPIG